jgi:membrane protease YdiL (CAAX protease family)
MRYFHSKPWLINELTLLSVMVPLAMSFLPSRSVLFPTLWLSALVCLLVYVKLRSVTPTEPVWRWEALRSFENWKPLLFKFVIAAIGLTCITLWLLPERFVSFPRENPGIWVMVMFLYPVLSVVPQEFIFRTYFFQRYGDIFTSPRAMVAASAIFFGFSHVILQNWVAIALCIIGGYLFADTYRKTRSLALVVAEHALYGCFVFTIGLGWFFYSGAPHKW